jgi:hypothetical protein
VDIITDLASECHSENNYNINYLTRDSYGFTSTSDLESEDESKAKNEHRRPVLLWVDLYHHLYHPSRSTREISQWRPGSVMASSVGNYRGSHR